MFSFKFLKIYIPLGSRNTWKKIENFWKKKFRFRKKKIRLRYRYRNWTLVSVPDAETKFRSHTSHSSIIIVIWILYCLTLIFVSCNFVVFLWFDFNFYCLSTGAVNAQSVWQISVKSCHPDVLLERAFARVLATRLAEGLELVKKEK